MLNPQSPRPLKAWQIILIIVVGVPTLWFGIHAYFRLCTVVGAFVFTHFGVGQG